MKKPHPSTWKQRAFRVTLSKKILLGFILAAAISIAAFRWLRMLPAVLVFLGLTALIYFLIDRFLIKPIQALTISVSFDVCETNEVLVAIGADADGDGDLSVDEADIVFGCDCGAWYRADLRTGAAPTEGSDPTVEATNALVIGKGQFVPAWNRLKVVRRGLGEISETVELDEERVRFDIRVR